MAKKIAAKDPPTIAEIRKIRQKLVQQGGGTIEGFIRVSNEIVASLGIKVTHAKPPRKRRSA